MLVVESDVANLVEYHVIEVEPINDRISKHKNDSERYLVVLEVLEVV